MSSDDIAIRVTNLGKCYQLYDTPRDRLKQFVIPRLQRVAGRAPLRYFREFRALLDVSFTIRKGETVGIIGRNGSGKSTLLQLICGTLTPTSGTVETNGRVAALLELGAGFNPEFTGRENVFISARILGLSHQQIEARFADIEAFADIGNVIDQAVKTYSSGMTIRLAFAVVAHVEADILVIDEALAVGDVFFVQKCMRFLRAFMKTGTVLFASHDTGAVQNLCQHVIWLDHGKVLQKGSPKSVCESYMQAFYEAQQGNGGATTHNAGKGQDFTPPLKHERLHDPAGLQNDPKVFDFNSGSAAFGKKGARITCVRLTNVTGGLLPSVVGGEQVVLTVESEVRDFLDAPIVGFYVKDRLGQTLFGDNTYLTFLNSNTASGPGTRLIARFTFCMPYLPRGDYSVAAGVANGSQDMHTMEHCIHDAIIFHSDNPRVAGGLIGIPMQEISLHRMTPSAAAQQ